MFSCLFDDIIEILDDKRPKTFHALIVNTLESQKVKG